VDGGDADELGGLAEGEAMPIAVNPVRLQRLMDKLRLEQNWVAGTLAGAVAGMAAAALWAFITFATGYQIGFMAVGVGFVVGYAIRVVGKGVDQYFGVIGAALALLGCVLGNVLAMSAIMASELNAPFFEVLGSLEWRTAGELLLAWFSPIDLIFYAIAIYEGYRLSFRRLSEDELLSVAE
jgi:hypothetical protein